MIAIIKLATKFLLFFQKFSFHFSIWTIKLAFRYICTITIYDSSSTRWQRQDPAFQQILALLTKKVDGINFQVVLIVELFLTKMVRKRAEQMIIRWSQVRKIKWMRNGNLSELQEFFTGRFCNMRSRVVMQIGNSIFFPLSFSVIRSSCWQYRLTIMVKSLERISQWIILLTPHQTLSIAFFGISITLRYCPVCFTSA